MEPFPTPEAIEQIAQLIHKHPHQVHHIEKAQPFLIVPYEGHDQENKPFKTFRVESIDDIHTKPTPKRHVVFTGYEPDCWIDYVQSMATDDSRIFADDRSHTFLCIFDYMKARQIVTGKGEVIRTDPAAPADWCRERAALNLRLQPEAADWFAMDEKQATQEELTEFLEDHAADVADVSVDEFKRAIESLHITRQVQFRRTINTTSNTVQFAYQEIDEQTEKPGQTGSIELPTRFTVRCPIFDRSNPFEITVRLRYSMNGGKLKFSLRFPGLDRVKRTAFDLVANKLRQSLPDIPMHVGSAQVQPHQAW